MDDEESSLSLVCFGISSTLSLACESCLLWVLSRNLVSFESCRGILSALSLVEESRQLWVMLSFGISSALSHVEFYLLCSFESCRVLSALLLSVTWVLVFLFLENLFECDFLKFRRDIEFFLLFLLSFPFFLSSNGSCPALNALLVLLPWNGGPVWFVNEISRELW